VSLPDDANETIMNLDLLAFARGLPYLIELIVHGWEGFERNQIQLKHPFTLPRIVRLKVEGLCIDEETLGGVVKLCPSLLHLHIDSTSYSRLSPGNNISSLPTSLQSLTLE